MAFDYDALRLSFKEAADSFDGPDALVIAFSARVIQNVLGREWWERHLELAEQPDPFVRNAFGAHAVDRAWHVNLFVTLAHSLFALRNADRFDVLLDRLQHRPLRQTYFEVYVAEAFAAKGFTIEIVEEVGRRGEDFDLRVTRAGRAINVEVTEVQQALPDATRLLNKLNQKRSQLPADGPGILAIIIPDAWVLRGAETEAVLAEATSGFFRSSKRVNQLLVCFTAQERLASGQNQFTQYVRYYNNPSPRSPIAAIDWRNHEVPFEDLHELQAARRTPTKEQAAFLARLTEQPTMSFYRWFLDGMP